VSSTWPQLTADQWIETLESNIVHLRGPNSIMARNVANKLATTFVGDDPLEQVVLLQAAREQLPTIEPPRNAHGYALGGNPAPDDRTPAFDEAMERFIALFRECVQKRRQIDAEIAANAHLDYDACLETVLAYLILQRDGMFVRPIMVGTKLSNAQVVDALQWISDRGFMSEESHRGTDAWYVKVNSYARDGLNQLQRKRQPRVEPYASAKGAAPPAHVSLHFGDHATFVGSPIGVSGTGDVTISNESMALPAVPEELRSVLNEDVFAAKALADLKAELATTVPRKNVVVIAFGALKTSIEAATVGTELAVHGSTWLTAVYAVLAHAHLIPQLL
jgi:hypothetical protein